VRRTSFGDLVIPFLIIGGAVYVLLRVSYDSIPPLQLYAPIPLALLGVAELIAARRVRAAVRHDRMLDRWPRSSSPGVSRSAKRPRWWRPAWPEPPWRYWFG